MPFYRVFGLDVHAEIPLPGVPEQDVSVITPDLLVRHAPVPAALPTPLVSGPFWQVDQRSVLLSIPDLGSLLASDGRTLDVFPAPGAPLAGLLPFAMGTGMAALLYQRGSMVLHASAVEYGGRAVVLCGDSGLGKSTLAAALCRQGCTFISDDLARITLGPDGMPRIWPDGRMLKLYPSSIHRLGLEAGQGPEIRPGVDKYYVTPPAPPAHAALPVAAVYALTRQKPGWQAGFRPLAGLDRAQALLNWSYRRRLALALAQTGGYRLPGLSAAVQARVPLFRLTRPQDLAAVEDLAAAVLHHLGSLPEAA